MATDDQQVLVTGTSPAPASFRVPGNGQIQPKSIFAHFNGASAASSFVPAVKVFSDGGELVAICPCPTTVAAGASADVSWFPHVVPPEAVSPPSGGGGFPVSGGFDPSISDGNYNAFGFIDQFTDGTLVIVYRRGTSHESDKGVLVMRTSTDGAASWSPETVIFSDSTYDCRNASGGVLDGDRLVVFFLRFDYTGFNSVDQGYIYSDSQGSTWSPYTQVSHGAETQFSPYGGAVKNGNGDWCQSWYGWHGSSPLVASNYVLFSSDNGASWGSQVTIKTDSTNVYEPTETSLAYLGSGYMLALARENGPSGANGTTFRQYQSADNGATWTDEGNTSFDSWAGAVPTPPWLAVFFDSGGARQLACYWFNRLDKVLRVSYASASGLIASNTAAWGAKIDITTSTHSGSGYPSAIQAGGITGSPTQQVFGWFFDEVSSSVANIVFFLAGSVGGSVPITEGSATAKGDMLAASSANVWGVEHVGSDGQVLTADSTQALGVKWAAASAAGVSSLDGITGAVTLTAGTNITITDSSPSAGHITIAAAGSSGPGIGASSLVYRYTVSGSDKASIDTGVDTANAGSNDWTNADLLEVWILSRTDDAGATSSVLVNLNNDGGAHYDRQALTGSNTTASAGLALAATAWTLGSHGSGGSASYAAAIRISLPDFSGTTFFKTGEAASARLDATAANNAHQVDGLGWQSTSAITRLALAATAGQKLKVGSQLLIYKRLAS